MCKELEALERQLKFLRDISSIRDTRADIKTVKAEIDSLKSITKS